MVKKNLFAVMVLVFVMVGFTSACIPRATPLESPVSPLAIQSPFSVPVNSSNRNLGGYSFYIEEPLYENATLVQGQGPVNISIAIVDITMMGEVIGRGRVDDTGYFRIEVASVIANHRIGIMLDALLSYEYTPEILIELENYKGVGAMYLPHIGLIYDATSVTVKP